MFILSVEEMSCGHCVASVTRAVQAIDANARVEVDLAAKTVRVDSAADPGRIAAAIEQAGFPVTPG